MWVSSGDFNRELFDFIKRKRAARNREICYTNVNTHSLIGKVGLYGYMSGEVMIVVTTRTVKAEKIAPFVAEFIEPVDCDFVEKEMFVTNQKKEQIISFLKKLASIDHEINLLIPNIQKNLNLEVEIPTLQNLCLFAIATEISKERDSKISANEIESLPESLQQEANGLMSKKLDAEKSFVKKCNAGKRKYHEVEQSTAVAVKSVVYFSGRKKNSSHFWVVSDIDQNNQFTPNLPVRAAYISEEKYYRKKQSM